MFLAVSFADLEIEKAVSVKTYGFFVISLPVIFTSIVLMKLNT